jgi:hypothetical protein
MAQIDKPNLHFNTKLYTGTGSSNSVTGVGFAPDFIWIKDRGTTYSHTLTDKVRGTSKELYTNNTNAETSYSQGITSFDSNGFTLGTDLGINSNGGSKVSWNWKASGSTASNSNGSITSTVSANTTSGFSIVKYVGNATSGATVGHGLGVAPKVVIIKSRDSALSWRSYFAALGATKFIELNATATPVTASNFMNDTAPTSTVFSLGNGTTPNKSGDNYIAYCFAEKKGFSKFGSYTGNASTNGTFIYLGFRPSFFLVKNTATTEDWMLYDNKRDPINPLDTRLRPNRDLADTTNTDYYVDFLSNGMKLRAVNSAFNGSGNTMIYMAFAENPIVGSNNVAAVAG